MGKTGRFLLGALALVFAFSAEAAKLSAEVDRNEIALGESVNLVITLEADELFDFSPKFEAPDFDPINQYEQQSFSWINGQTQKTRSVTVVLNAKKAGSLKIRNIATKTPNGDYLTAADLAVTVSSGQDSSTKAIDGAAPKLSGENKYFFIRAEPTKTKVYRGETFVVSYYLYRRTQTQIRDVVRFPTFTGFTREDLEMPVLSNRLNFEAVSLGGVPFERALIARYALTPIQTGALKIDSLGLRADYVPRESKMDDMFNDPFFQFFQQVNPRSTVQRSDPINIEVSNLPPGASPLFGGGVGSFSAGWRTEGGKASTGNPISLFLDVRGQGNVREFAEPKINWPKSFRVFDSRGSVKEQSATEMTKTFEFVIIPSEEGAFSIPEVKFETFDPATKEYKTGTVPPLSLTVVKGVDAPKNEAPPGDSGAENQPEPGAKSATLSAQQFALKPGDEASKEAPRLFLGQPWWRWLFWLATATLLITLGMVIWDSTKRQRRDAQNAILGTPDTGELLKKWLKDAERDGEGASPDSGSLTTSFRKLSELLPLAIDQKFQLKSAAMPRRELGRLLTEQHALPAEVWAALRLVLDRCDSVLFAPRSPSAEELQSDLREVVKNIQEVLKLL